MKFAVLMNVEKVYDRMRRALRYLLRVMMFAVIGHMMGKIKALFKRTEACGW